MTSESLIELIEGEGIEVDNDIPNLFTNSLYYDNDSFIKLFKNLGNSFTIISLNCQSLYAKLDDLKAYLETLAMSDCEVSAICLQETWIKDSENNNLLQLNGYNFIGISSTCSLHGGVGIYLSKSYDYKILNINDKNNIWDGLFIEITNANNNLGKNLIIGNIYRPPRENIDNYQIFINDLNKVFNEFLHSHSEVALVGDFNIDLLKFKEKAIINEYLNTILSNGYLPKITFPTRITHHSSTLIDNAFVRLSNNLSDIVAGILTHRLSDHQPYFLVFKNRQMKHSYKNRYVKIFPFNTHLLNKFINDIEASNIMQKINLAVDANPNENYNILNDIIKSSIDKHLPTKLVRFRKCKHKKNKWITIGIINSIKYRDRLYKKLHYTPRDSNDYFITKQNLNTYNKMLRNTIRHAKKLYYLNCFKKFSSDIRKTWEQIKEVISGSSNTSHYPCKFLLNDVYITGADKIANEFNKYFINVGPKLISKVTLPNGSFKDYLNLPVMDSFQFQDIDSIAIGKIINDLKPKTSIGIDGLSSKLLKLLKDYVALPLSMIINQSFRTGIFPDKLKIAKVIPIYKKDDNFIFDNYRPISILPSISKVFERAIHNQLHNHFVEKNLYYSSQYGFRPKHSTELAALELLDQVIIALDKKQTPINIYLDLSKAFDTINHDILLHKLKYYGIQGNSLKLLSSYLSNRYQYVEYNNTISNMLRITTGVPQGSILGPLLFLIYINDIKNVCQIFHPIVYADDTTLSATLASFGDKPLQEDNINKEISKITLWLKHNKLALNIKKTKAMIFHMPQKKIHLPVIQIDNTPIEFVDEFNFLGIIIDKHICFKQHVTYVSNKLSKTNGILNRVKHFFPSEVLLILYNTLIVPHLNYGILAWESHHMTLFKLQKKAIRIITNAKYNAHTDPIFKRLKLLKLPDICTLQKLKFCFKLENNSLPSYFLQGIFIKNAQNHTYNTRRTNDFELPKISHRFSKQGIRFSIPNAYNQADINVKSKIYTHSLKGYTNYIKMNILNSYEELCLIRDCYICHK